MSRRCMVSTLSSAALREVAVSVTEERDMQLRNLAAVLITAYQNAASVQLPLQKASLNRYACPWVSYVNGINDSHRSGNYLDRV